MPSKQVTDRQKSAALVLESARENETKIAQGMFQLLGVATEHGSAVVRAMGAKLEGKVGEMVAADHAHLTELGDDAAVRAERDLQAGLVNGQLVDLRDAVKLAYGDNEVGKLGFDGRTPSDATQVHSLGTLVVDNLATWQPTQPARIPGLTVDATTWSANLSGPVGKLGTAISSIARETREAEATLVAKNRAIEEYDKVFGVTASFLSLMLEVAGEDELARRVRPSRRRSGQTAEVANDAKAATEVDQPAPQEG